MIRATLSLLALVAGSALLHAQAPATQQARNTRTQSLRAAGPEVVDFEGLATGMIVDQVFGSAGTGPIQVFAANPNLGPFNAALIFDSSNPTGEDPDLGTPNQAFGGPGVGAGGGPGSSFPNNRRLGKVLIVGEDLNDADGDGLVDDPDDADLMMEPIEFDFGGVRVRARSITVLDVDPERQAATVRMFDGADNLLSEVLLPQVGDNGLATTDLGDQAGVARMVVTLNGSGALDELTFQRHCTGAIGDFVWHDLNRDGVQNAGEPGIQGVDVLLLDSSGQIVQVQTTGSRGEYLFGRLCLGTYTVMVDESTLPPDFVPSPCNVGNDALDNDCSPVEVVLPTDDTFEPRVDFGYQSLMDGEVGDFVWHDLDRDGLQDAGEPGIEGVLLRLFRDGEEIAQTTTGRLGEYVFRGLAAGPYLVEVDAATLPPGFSATACNVGADDGVDNDCSPAPALLPTGASSDRTVDFGYASDCQGCAGDLVWNDLNRNGIRDASEPGLEGITVRLLDLQGNQLAVATTGPEGEYEFRGLCGGSYVIEVDESTLPPGYVPSPCNNGDDDEADSDCSPLVISLEGDADCNSSFDFGYRGTGNGQIGDFVWFDEDCDGIQDLEVGLAGVIAEPGIEGVRILLRDDKGVILGSRTTDGNGEYVFGGLSDGTYIVEVEESTLPSGVEATTCNAGSDAGADNNCSPAIVVLGGPALTLELTVDFGFRTEDCLGQGCTPGYWRQDHHHDSWPAPYLPDMLFSDVFEDAFPGMTLDQVVAQGGGGLNALGRHVVAALLNAASPDVLYELTPSEVVQMFNDVHPGTNGDYEAVKDVLAGLNERHCPLN